MYSRGVLVARRIGSAGSKYKRSPATPLPMGTRVASCGLLKNVLDILEGPS